MTNEQNEGTHYVGDGCNPPHVEYKTKGIHLPSENTTVQRWADQAMFPAEPSDATDGPRVYLLAGPADPLGAIAAAASMYEGLVVRDLVDVTDFQRRHYLGEMQKTKLAMPLETVQFHFLIDNVTRAFTHQLVRQRTAAYAQESMRFAVVEDDFVQRVALPPSLSGTTGEPALEVRNRYEAAKQEFKNQTGKEYSEFLHQQFTDDFNRLPKPEQWRSQWDALMYHIQRVYQSWVDEGMPAEDARGILPTNITTRVHYITNLRALLDHAGNRLCTQAQFEWRQVFGQLKKALREFPIGKGLYYKHEEQMPIGIVGSSVEETSSSWQYNDIAELLLPVCYQRGHCVFTADFDRKCSIRNRVQANHEIARPSDKWGEELDRVQGNPVVSGAGPQSVVRNESNQPVFIGAIQPIEWLADPSAAR